MQWLASTFKSVKTRTKELQEIWKPIAKPLGLISSIGTALGAFKWWYTKSGPYFLGTLVLAALSALLLYTVPILSVRLFVKRLVAFVIDVLAAFLLTVGALSLVYRTQIVNPSALVSMAITWAWVLISTLIEWRFEGSFGCLALGMRLRAVNSLPSLVGCLARNLIALVVPFVIAGEILSIPPHTNLHAKLTWSLVCTMLLFLPLSIMFAGGQSFTDIILRLAVVPKGGQKEQTKITRRTIGLTLLSATLAGVTIGFLPSLFEVATKKPRPEDVFPMIEEVHISVDDDVRSAAGLWTQLQAKAPVTDGPLEDVRVFSIFGDLPITGERSEQLASSPCQSSYKVRHAYKLIRLQFDYGTPVPVIVAAITALGKIRMTGRPAFLVVELSVSETYGFFRVEAPQQHLLCLSGTDSEPRNEVVDVHQLFAVEASINEVAWLITARLDVYSEFEHVPIFPGSR